MALSLADYCIVHNLKSGSKAAQSRYNEYLNNLDLFDSVSHPKVKPPKLIASNEKAVNLEDIKVAKTIGAKLAAMRVIEDKVCALEGCGKIITGIKKKKYCDDTCKQRAKYQRKKSKSDKEQELSE